MQKSNYFIENYDDLTMIIPTKNRSVFLKKVLFYYSNFASNLEIIIVDSSDPKHRSVNQMLVKNMKSEGRNIKYLYVEDYTDEKIFKLVSIKILTALKMCQNNFIILAGDDDIYLNDGIAKSLEFIKKNPDYATVHGEIIGAYFSDNNGKFSHIASDRRIMGNIEDETQQERLNNYINNHYEKSTYFYMGIHRKKDLTKIFGVLKESQISTTYAEILFNLLILSSGKAKKLNCLYMIKGLTKTKERSNIDRKEECLDNEIRIFESDLCKYTGTDYRPLMRMFFNIISYKKSNQTKIKNSVFFKLKNTLKLLITNKFLKYSARKTFSSHQSYRNTIMSLKI